MKYQMLLDIVNSNIVFEAGAFRRTRMHKCTDIKSKEKFLLDVFDDADFINELGKIRINIENEIKKFIIYLKSKLNDDQKIFENIESRIKSKERFHEKIYRKDYINLWDVCDDLQLNKRMVSQNLTDLIGFRINCFFWQDEEVIYKLLKDYYKNGLFEKIELNFNENKTQKNGHTINKVSGTYCNEKQEKFCFEIQIKSIMHNIWGEVEHKTIYKNKGYDPNIIDKKTITEQIFNILRASDKQLLTLLNKKQDEKELIISLFYEKTKEVVGLKCGTDILGEHYVGYFNIFSNIDNIKEYVAFSLINKEFEKKNVEYGSSNPEVKALSLMIKSKFPEYKLKCLYHIHEVLYNATSFDDFMIFLAKFLYDLYSVNDFDELDGFESFDEFDEDDSEMASKDFKENLLTLLEEKIGGC